MGIPALLSLPIGIGDAPYFHRFQHALPSLAPGEAGDNRGESLHGFLPEDADVGETELLTPLLDLLADLIHRANEFVNRGEHVLDGDAPLGGEGDAACWRLSVTTTSKVKVLSSRVPNARPPPRAPMQPSAQGPPWSPRDSCGRPGRSRTETFDVRLARREGEHPLAAPAHQDRRMRALTGGG